jgi:hypothetical protein
MSASEFLSSSAFKDEEKTLYGAIGNTPLDETFYVGGDSRYLYLKDGRAFWMQNDVELAVFPAKNLALVGSVGVYHGEEKLEVESRRNYLLFLYNENITVRAGRFFPAYGIMLEDHTAATRSGLGWDEGRETYNFEVSLKNEHGEIFLSPILGGTDNNVRMRSRGYTLQGDQKGFAGRAALYLGKGSLAGVSVLGLQHLTPGGGYTAAGGVFGILGISQDVYTLIEADILEVDRERSVLAFSQVGYEIVRGLHLQAQYQRYATSNEIGGRVQWFMRPHLEVVTAYAWRAGIPRALILLHYYL